MNEFFKQKNLCYIMVKCVYDADHEEYICIKNKQNLEYYNNSVGYPLYLERNHHNQILSSRSIIILCIVFFIISIIIETTVHEMGHALALTYFGIDIEVMQTIFGTLFTHGRLGGFVQYYQPFDITDQQQYIIILSGPLFALLIPTILFIIAYSYKLPPKVEFFAIVYMLTSILCLIEYVLCCYVFGYTDGDWYHLAEIYPITKPIIIIFSFSALVIYIIVLNKMIYERFRI